MNPEEFRQFGYAVVDWIVKYQKEVGSYPVLSQVRPGEILQSIPVFAPENGEPFENILKDVDKLILPGITHWQSPHFYAYFPANSSGPSILADLISSGLGVQGMLWATSPACTELEIRMLDWLVSMLGLPESYTSKSAGGGVIQDSASSAALCAMIAARERMNHFKTRDSGYSGGLVAYCSTQAHSSIEKAAMICGLGANNLRKVVVDDLFAMNVDAFRQQLQKDKADGLTPFFATATLGTTSSNAIDPIEKIGRICQQEKLWFHVDGAMAGTAAICPEYRYLHDDLAIADSYCFNPHKWMLTNFDCSCFFVSDRSALIKALSILPEYLRNQASDSGNVIDYRDWQVPLGRRFRSLKLWFVIRYYGIQGIQQLVRNHVSAAQQFASWIRQSKDFELVVEPPLNLVCFRHREGDAFNQALLANLNSSGKLFLTHTTLNGHYILRLCVGQTHTTLHHVKEAWEKIQSHAVAMQKSSPPQ